MASIKVKFSPSRTANREGTIYYQIIHERTVRQITTDYHVFPSEWNERNMTVTSDMGHDRKSFILTIRERIHADVERFRRIERKLNIQNLPYTADDIIYEFHRYFSDYTLSRFMESLIMRLKLNDKIRTSETYRSALVNFMKFRDGEDIMLDSISSEIIESYEAWQKNRGITLNTISFYMRILRAVYNRAVDADIIEDRNPFNKVYTGVDKTLKRALPLNVIRKIKRLDLSLVPELDYARDMFILSFYLRGMSFIDMAFLKKTDLQYGHVVYRRRKTGQQLVIGWTNEMQLILDKYPENESDYLLPIIRHKGTNERYAYRNKGYNINHNLKKIADMVGVSVPLTLYVARHSWASAAKAKGIPMSVISEGMGHRSEMTTRIYLASLDTSVVDRANSIIMKSLR